MKKLIVPLMLFASLIAVPTALKGMGKRLEEAEKTRAEMRKARLIQEGKPEQKIKEEEEEKKEEEPEETPKLLQEQKVRQLGLDGMMARAVSLLKNLRSALKEFQTRAAVINPQTWKDIGLFLDKAASLVALYATLQAGIEWTETEAAKKRAKHWHIGKKKKAKLNAEADKLDEKTLLLEKMKSRLEQEFPQLKEVVLP